MLSMPASRPYHHGDLRAALLKSAEHTLREKGVAALSLRELARDVGVSHAAPGRHFKDKQALLDALALTGYERLLRALGAADAPERPIQERMTRLARAYLGFVIDNPALLELMFARKHEPDTTGPLADAVEETFGSLTHLVADAQERGEIVPGDPERLMMVVASSLHGLAALVAACALSPEEALAGLDEQVHHLLYGLAPR
ncbi:TetR/AcrR family transcriptional regulator [Streptomyces thermocoprophilus]|jgi:AcrR family transcriptional regulator|uniref:TetR/AcrR family transcriptional regulator n=1 Tax=Streptomyces thermocoprophilus TaxID=78356 RepID=A0ABV5VLP0_9ACTN